MPFYEGRGKKKKATKTQPTKKTPHVKLVQAVIACEPETYLFAGMLEPLPTEFITFENTGFFLCREVHSAQRW